ncbi:MAG: hypothetical protein KIT84_19290 [Labilithrix sp.]|nr:hypothetical protein [Labilithrix sp.]MCW5813180.1 hypothetical protein [Labilithrix sp.]
MIPAVYSHSENRRPLPSSLSVRAARDAYLEENGFDVGGYTADTFDVEAFGRKYTFTNSSDRKWAIPLHDLHHVATGYGTDLVGEAEIGAFELVGGCRTPVVYALNVVAVLVGFALAPVRTLRAFLHARRAGARALYRSVPSVDPVLDIPLGDLRARLGIPRGGLSSERRRLHDEGEARRADALPSAPPQRRWVVALGLVNGLATAGTVMFELWRGRTLEGVPLAGGARAVAYGVLAAGLVMAASAPSLRRGSIGGRALFGHAALALIVLDVVSALRFGMAPALAAAACAAPILLLLRLMR